LADCQEKDQAKAKSSSLREKARVVRQRTAVTVIPSHPTLRGKVLNVERARFDKMISSEQIGTLITALGAALATKTLILKNSVITASSHVRRGRGCSHIRTLLLTFFFRQMPEIIERGYLYIAQPTLWP